MIIVEPGSVTTQTCATVVLTPGGGTTPLPVGLGTSTAGAHIFYTKVSGATGVNPTHSGDSATGITQRIGSSSGSISVGAGEWTVRALAYAPGFLDSAISEGDYSP